jgi:hypothetical protein
VATNPVLRWTKSPSANVNSYPVTWTLNGTAASPISIPQSAAGDSGGYSTTFNDANPGVVLKGGDVVAATVAAFDSVDNLSSAPVPAGPLTIPATAPEPPQSVSLTLA